MPEGKTNITKLAEPEGPVTIFSATRLAMLENIALQVADVWYLGPVTLRNFLSKLSRKTRSVRMRPC